jgi:hypothetical protein
MMMNEIFHRADRLVSSKPSGDHPWASGLLGKMQATGGAAVVDVAAAVYAVVGCMARPK